MANHHKRVRVRVDEQSALIDEGLADIVRLLWENGLQTTSCCENAGESFVNLLTEAPHMADYVQRSLGRAYIDFPSEDALAFMDLISEFASREMSLGMKRRMAHWMAPDAWEKDAIAVNMKNRARGWELLGLHISFPVSDIEDIKQCLQLGMRSAWSGLFPEGRHLYYEGRDPQGFVEQVKSKYAFDPSKDPAWGQRVEPGDGHEGFDSFSFDCPPRLLNAIYGRLRFPLGS